MWSAPSLNFPIAGETASSFCISIHLSDRSETLPNLHLNINILRCPTPEKQDPYQRESPGTPIRKTPREGTIPHRQCFYALPLIDSVSAGADDKQVSIRLFDLLPHIPSHRTETLFSLFRTLHTCGWGSRANRKLFIIHRTIKSCPSQWTKRRKGLPQRASAFETYISPERIIFII